MQEAARLLADILTQMVEGRVEHTPLTDLTPRLQAGMLTAALQMEKLRPDKVIGFTLSLQSSQAKRGNPVYPRGSFPLLDNIL